MQSYYSVRCHVSREIDLAVQSTYATRQQAEKGRVMMARAIGSWPCVTLPSGASMGRAWPILVIETRKL